MYVGAVAEGMRKISYAGYRFPPEVIHQAIWFYLRFTLSFRDGEDLLAERGIAVSYETVLRWVNHFGPMIAGRLCKRRVRVVIRSERSAILDSRHRGRVPFARERLGLRAVETHGQIECPLSAREASWLRND